MLTCEGPSDGIPRKCFISSPHHAFPHLRGLHRASSAPRGRPVQSGIDQPRPRAVGHDHNNAPAGLADGFTVDAIDPPDRPGNGQYPPDWSMTVMAAVIEVEALTKRFGSTQALAGVDLVAEEGKVLALLGPNGAGKTTLVRILATLLKPDRGRARGA